MEARVQNEGCQIGSLLIELKSFLCRRNYSSSRGFIAHQRDCYGGSFLFDEMDIYQNVIVQGGVYYGF
jgi:hypothetical protein